MRNDKIWFATALLPEGWRDGVLVEIGPRGDIAAVRPGAPPEGADAFHGAALPGVPNVHSHAHQRAMAGLTEHSGPGPDSFWTWRELMYRFLGTMTPDDLEAVAAQLYVELLKAGFTAVGEFQYLHHQPDGRPYSNRAEMSLRTLAAARATGIGITLLPTLYAHGGFGGAPPTEGQRRFVNDAEGFLEIVETLRTAIDGDGEAALGIAPHSLRAVTGECLAEVTAPLDRGGSAHPIHMHVAEQVGEVEDCMAWSGGARPAEWLMDNVGISPRWCLIHATHLSDMEVERLAASGAVVGLCPTTEANLGDGIFRAVDYLGQGGRIAVGTDSHVGREPAGELRALEYSQRLATRARNVLAGGPGRSTGRTLLDHVLAGGAQVMGRRLGRIAPGHRADMVVLDTEEPSLQARSGDRLVDTWIFTAGPAAVRDVFVGGRRVIAEGRHHDEEAIAGRYRSTLERLLS